MEIVGFTIIEIILSGMGWICLHVWYRDRKKVEEIKNKKYAGKYSAAATVITLNIVAGIGAIATFGMVIFILAFWLYQSVVRRTVATGFICFGVVH
jgi:hypothetical protein